MKSKRREIKQFYLRYDNNVSHWLKREECHVTNQLFDEVL